MMLLMTMLRSDPSSLPPGVDCLTIDAPALTADQGRTSVGCKGVYTPNNTQEQPSFYGPLSRTTRVSQYQQKHSPTHHLDHHPIFISFFNLPRSTASSLFKLRDWPSFCTTFLHVLFGLPLGLEPSTSYSIHFFTLFAAHAHTIATCFAVYSRNC